MVELEKNSMEVKVSNVHLSKTVFAKDERLKKLGDV